MKTYLKWIKLNYRHIFHICWNVNDHKKFLTNEYDKGKTYWGKIVDYIYIYTAVIYEMALKYFF